MASSLPFRPTLLCALAACLFIIAVEGPAHSAWAQTTTPPSDSTVQSDSTRPHPNDVPYESRRSVMAHVLAAPSYALHYATRPLGWAIVWAERNFPDLFEGRLPDYGLYPMLEVGGPVPISGGVVAFHQNLFQRGHRARLSAFMGSRSYNNFTFLYTLPRLWSASTRLEVRSRYFNDARQRFFLDGNDAGREDETRFAIEQFGATLRFGYQPAGALNGQFDLSYEHATARRTPDNIGPRIRIPAGTPGLGTADRLTVRPLITLDGTSGGRRANGPRLRLGASYTHEFRDEPFRYGSYLVEAQQFIPLPLLPNDRRFALRARLEQIVSLDDNPVPFYALNDLGGPETLRGFVTNRFSDTGLLLLTAEYRYPIWSSLDAVLFVDAGQVFDRMSDVGAHRFHFSGGGGLRVLSSQGMSLRLEIAISREATRTIFTLTPLF